MTGTKQEQKRVRALARAQALEQKNAEEEANRQLMSRVAGEIFALYSAEGVAGLSTELGRLRLHREEQYAQVRIQPAQAKKWLRQPEPTPSTEVVVRTKKDRMIRKILGHADKLRKYRQGGEAISPTALDDYVRNCTGHTSALPQQNSLNIERDQIEDELSRLRNERDALRKQIEDQKIMLQKQDEERNARMLRQVYQDLHTDDIQVVRSAAATLFRLITRWPTHK